MQQATVRQDGAHWLLYDAELWPQPSPEQFDGSYWQSHEARAADGGRGGVWFIPRGEREWVLRHYRRGGFITKISADQYIWGGLERSRAWREWHLLAKMRLAGLPVPRPVAARVHRQGLLYRQDLITERIAHALPFSEALMQGAAPGEIFEQLGRTLARFCAAGIGHADLNAANILLRRPNEFFLIDFDRGIERASAAFQQASLARLLRSFEKFRRLRPGFHFSAADWQRLLAGYQA